jgi:hypothetical protein
MLQLTLQVFTAPVLQTSYGRLYDPNERDELYSDFFVASRDRREMSGSLAPQFSSLARQFASGVLAGRFACA